MIFTTNIEEPISAAYFKHDVTFNVWYLQQILKNQLVLPILNTMFPIMCDIEEGEEQENEEDEVESQRPSQLAAQVRVRDPHN